MSLETVKCPHCSYVYRINTEAVVKDGKTFAIRGHWGQSKTKPDKEIYVDLKCHNCGKEFEWQIK